MTYMVRKLLNPCKFWHHGCGGFENFLVTRIFSTLWDKILTEMLEGLLMPVLTRGCHCLDRSPALAGSVAIFSAHVGHQGSAKNSNTGKWNQKAVIFRHTSYTCSLAFLPTPSIHHASAMCPKMLK